MLIYFVIFLSLAVILGPLMAVMPTHKQRALVQRRDRAREAGVTVTLREPDNIPPRLQRASDNVLVCYSVRLLPRESRNLVRDLYVRTRQGWQSKNDLTVPLVVTELPETVEVVQVGWDDIRLYWSERGDGDALEAVLAALAVLKSGEGSRHSQN